MLRLPVDEAWNPLNYLGVARSFSEVVGRQNVHILPLHLLGTAGYWEALARGTGLSADALGRIWQEHGRRMNRRRGTDNSWVVNRPLTLRGRLSADLKDRPALRRLLLHRMNLPVRALSLLTGGRAPSVKVDTGMRAAIMERFAEQNMRLAVAFGPDIEGAQYW